MINYYQEFLKITEELAKLGKKPKLLLHACCAPCSSSSLERVENIFSTDVFFFNPNITKKEEYDLRLSEIKSFLSRAHSDVKLIVGNFNPELFYAAVRGLEGEKEGGARCFLCYELRLRETAKQAKLLGYDYFASTLSVSPYKNADKLNEIGQKIGQELEVAYLPTDFKKNDGYKRSIELSKEYGLYRQNYCGCEFSIR